MVSLKVEMTSRDKVVISVLATTYLVSIVTNAPAIFDCAVLAYVVVFSLELFNYVKGQKQQGIFWYFIGKFEYLYGDFFVKILMSMSVIVVFTMIAISLVGHLDG
jgi:hypothetical protein